MSRQDHQHVIERKVTYVLDKDGSVFIVESDDYVSSIVVFW